ncbi:hypothetical protein MNBD_ALPHA04-1306 [hydrothermal vent metagenome]|uniref:DUF2231 domain-containing protein n=1 Tax=hydrothermal vent metagenome TaxID=652676 RepID=A0A3B0R7E0_9ZZZZ
MNLRIAFAGVILFLVPVTALQAHEAHRNNEPDPVATVDHAGMTNSGSSEKAGAKPPEHAHGENQVTGFDLQDFLGRLHPAAVHFPIALFLIAGLAELILFFNPTAGVGGSVRFLTWTGAAGGVVAATLGWFAGGFRLSDRSEILGLHRWTGTGVALTGIALAFLSGAAVGSRKRTVFRIILAIMAALILFQGYWGAEMSLGPDHMGLKKMGMMD